METKQYITIDRATPVFGSTLVPKFDTTKEPMMEINQKDKFMTSKKKTLPVKLAKTHKPDVIPDWKFPYENTIWHVDSKEITANWQEILADLIMVLNNLGIQLTVVAKGKQPMLQLESTDWLPEDAVDRQLPFVLPAATYEVKEILNQCALSFAEKLEADRKYALKIKALSSLEPWQKEALGYK